MNDHMNKNNTIHAIDNVKLNKDLFQVLIVQAAAYTAFLGEIKLYFDDEGDLVRWEGNPHFVGSGVEQGNKLIKIVRFVIKCYLHD